MFYQSCPRNKTVTLGDSAAIYKTLCDCIEEQYGISLQLKKQVDGHLKFWRRNISPADSGLALLPFYRDRVRLYTLNNQWMITTQKIVPQMPVEMKKRKRERN